MLFHSFAFFVFFCVTFGVYWALRTHEYRMAWLVVASIVFYAVWNPWFVLLIAFTAGVDYIFALGIERVATKASRRLLLIGCLVISLSLLVFFKYANFLVGASTGLIAIFGIHVLPLGISFYTFETISYVVDVYRGQLAAGWF